MERIVTAVLPDPMTDQNFFNLYKLIRYILIQELPGSIRPIRADFRLFFLFRKNHHFEIIRLCINSRGREEEILEWEKHS